MYSFVPFGVLFVVNIFLIRVLRQKIRNLAGSTSISKRSQLNISLSVVIMTLLFIVFTSPSAVCSQLISTLMTTHSGLLILSASGCFSFSYHAFNMVILCVFNKHFYKMFKDALLCGNVAARNDEPNKEDV